MNKFTKLGGIVAALVAGLLLTAGACDDSDADNKARAQRDTKSKTNVLCGETGESLECRNLKEKEKRNSDPNRIGYVYMYNFDGSIKGYFVVKGKVSSTQSQMAPMDDIVNCEYSSACDVVVEAAGDDGTYGPNENGIFFFLVNGTMVTYSGEYVLSDQPLGLSTKQLG